MPDKELSKYRDFDVCEKLEDLMMLRFRIAAAKKILNDCESA